GCRSPDDEIRRSALCHHRRSHARSKTPRRAYDTNAAFCPAATALFITAGLRELSTLSIRTREPEFRPVQSNRCQTSRGRTLDQGSASKPNMGTGPYSFRGHPRPWPFSEGQLRILDDRAGRLQGSRPERGLSHPPVTDRVQPLSYCQEPGRWAATAPLSGRPRSDWGFVRPPSQC